MKKNINKFLIIIISALVLLNGTLLIREIKEELKLIKIQSKLQQDLTTAEFTYLEQELKTITQNITKIVNKNYIDLDKKIIELPKLQEKKKKILEAKLQQINVMIINATLGASGSGVTLKYKDNFYILTAGHMAENIEDDLILMENGNQICKLEVVKQDYGFDDINVTQSRDLLLLKPKDKNIVPRFYVELADMEPQTANEIYIVGNPMGMEDVVSDGRVIFFKERFMYYIDHTYFGNSGGGIFTSDGKLIGIVSHLIPIQPFANVPAYMIYGATRLDVIKSFLEDVK